ncbi:DUF2514 family protein [Stutzerimonas degradans]|uniref:DUF2514 domain-containing protein n=1 Tax=Stutzerimonas degradans TaxID=2968968 RepID=A0A8E2U5R0_9GAMM|nr:DUF2514 family protein [Stutzerimonas degradans]MCQ4274493.1 DUF2514 domain-containing protein [Stutzerimonas degradans]PNF77924.1 DUF2514 domain-containing protein [Stutzerimonas degradans]QPT23319.1 DUF2514 family protein [Stutzerimonas degradans]
MIGAWVERSTVYGLLAALCFVAGWKVNGWRLGEGIAQDQYQAVQVVRVVERQQQAVADTEGQKGHEELENLRRAAADAGVVAAGLRREAGRLATQLATCNAGTAGERQARANAAAVFADVLVEMESAGRAMAEQADRSRGAGLTCERVYDGVRAAAAE